METIYQQGDVLLVAVKSIPLSAKPCKPDPRGLVLAEGEATGHAHVVRDAGCALLEVEDKIYLSAADGATTHHEEHKAVTVPPGVYEVRKVREVDPFNEEVRSVKD
jgi:hypothetical protein